MRFSLCIAAHNEGETLLKTVQSCYDSLGRGRDFEVVIADDASTDDAVARTLDRHPHVRLVRHAQRLGASPAKHAAARAARGETLVFLDGHCKPEEGAILRLVEQVERFGGHEIVTPAVPALDVAAWRNSTTQVGHGYRLGLERLDCGWLGRSDLRPVSERGQALHESPALIGCALAIGRRLYEDLRGFDPHMRGWGVEDLDFGLKAVLLGHRVLNDPAAVIGHRFRRTFDNFAVTSERVLANQLRLARKHLTDATWSQWVERCRGRNARRLAGHPEGLFAAAWDLFQADRQSVEAERSYLLAHHVHDEFWYADRYGLDWPRLGTEGGSRPAALAAFGDEPEGSGGLEGSEAPSPEPSEAPPCKVLNVSPKKVMLCVGQTRHSRPRARA